MVDTNRPNSNEQEEDESSQDSFQVDPEQMVETTPPPVVSRFGPSPELRSIPYDHPRFVRQTDSLGESSSNVSIVSSPYACPLGPTVDGSPTPTIQPVPLQILLLSQVPRIGYFVPRITGLNEILNDLRREGYEFLALNMARKVSEDQIVPVCDLLLSSTDWITHTAAYINTEECVSSDSARFPFLDVQFNHAQHLSIKDVIVQCPEDFEAVTKLSRVINARMEGGFATTRFHIHLPVQSRHAQVNLQINDLPQRNPKRGSVDVWSYWNQLRSQVGYDRRLGVAIELDGDLPDEDDLARWCGEPVSMIIIPFIMFMPTRQLGVKMPDPYVDFVNSLINANARQISILVKGHVPAHIHPKMIEYLSQFGKNWVSDNLVDEFAIGYEDYLQIPLQPLADNLESSTYEIFEKDPIKYASYEKAMVKALLRLPEDQRVVVLLVGAGRGPLIRCCLLAAQKTGRLINLYAIEKNSCAAHTLQSQEWVDPPAVEGTPVSTVTVFNIDIRDWTAPEMADIVISELLGSFGDNELSPECLDGTWRCVKPEAISIPESYRSYVQPIMSNRLYTETLAEGANKPVKYTDYIFVAHMKSFFAMSKVQQLFEFVHRDLSKPPTERDNSRYMSLDFKPHTECVLHGFAGYFDTTLIDDITLSIVPETHTTSLISWFPVWIPLATPVHVKPSDTITLHFWRNVSRQKVWYEWCIQSPVATRIQNSNGKTHSVGL